MNHRTLVLLTVTLLVAAAAAPMAGAGDAVYSSTDELECVFPHTTEDATGEEVTLEEPPERIVTTNPSAAQILWEFGAEDSVVGVTEYAMYLENADEREVVTGDDGMLVTEKVIALEPDLVLAPNATGTQTVDQLRDAGLTVYHFEEATTMADVMEKTETIGELTGECEAGVETSNWMDERITLIEEAVADEDHPEVLYAFFNFVAGDGTHIHDMVEIAGAKNLAAEAGISGYAPISEEVVIDRDPEWIVLNANDPVLPDSEGINQTTAAQKDQQFVVEIEHINQPAPWNIYAIETMVEHFHPEAWEAATSEGDDEAPTDDTADDGQTDDADDVSTTDTGTDDEPTDDALPGFGPVVALIAVLAGSGATIRIRRG